MRLFVEVREPDVLIGRAWVGVSEVVPEESGTILVALFPEARNYVSPRERRGYPGGP